MSEPAGAGGWPAASVIVVLSLVALGIAALAWPLRRRRSPLRVATLAAILLALCGVAAVRLALVGSIGTLPERLAIVWRLDRLRLLETRTFWISPTPERPGSHGPFDTGPHIAFAAIFARIPGGDTLTVVNTHVGHSPLERARAARVLRGWLDTRWNGSPQILLGDLNATPDNPLLGDLRAAAPGGAPGLRDAWTEASRRGGPATTYHWSRPARDFFPLRIDYVLLRGEVRAASASVVGASRGGVVASDHDALIVDLALD